MTIEAEEWRPVVGWEGLYKVSNLGRVKSHPRRLIIEHPNGDVKCIKLKSKLLLQYRDKWGYACVSLSINKQHKVLFVHRLVAEAFIGPIPSGMWVLHGRLDNKHNNLDNLYIGTPKQNAADRIRDNTQAKGSKNGRAKLNEQYVLRIKSQLANNVPVARIAREAGVSRKAIYLIRDGHNWKWLNSTEPIL